MIRDGRPFGVGRSIVRETVHEAQPGRADATERRRSTGDDAANVIERRCDPA